MSDLMDPSKLKVAELRAELQARDLDSKGNKPVLVERLRVALEEEAAAHEEGDEVAGGEGEEEEQEEEEEVLQEAENEEEEEEEEELPVAAEEPEPTQKEPEADKKPESPVKKTGSPQKEAEPSPKKSVPEPSPKKSVPEPSPKKSVPEPSPKKSVPEPSPKKSVPEPSPKKSMPEPSPKKSVPEPSPKKSVPEPSPKKSVPEPSPKKSVPEPSKKAPEAVPSVKVESEDSAKLGYEDAPMEELADKSEAGNGMDTTVKEEEMEIKEEDVEVKQEEEETEESGSTARRGAKRALSRSRSPETAPEAKKQRPEVEEVRIEDEPDFDKTVVALDWYNSDLSLVISKDDFLSAQPLTMQGFGYVWHGVRATYGFTRGRVFFEVKGEDYLPVPQLEEDEQHPHVLRVGWSVDDAGLTLGEDPFSYGYGGTGKASTNLKFKDYGKTFGKGDVLGCFLDLESEPVVMSFTVNGQNQGIAYEVSHSDLGDQALFPHIVTKNTSFKSNFGTEAAWMEPLNGYTFTGKIPLEDRVLGSQGPEKREDAEITGIGIRVDY
ncbi:Heterogeneous nuclear ribonucleoprotein U-like protein 1 [Chionoecetes opilio]|uniref:Heterogeneous nuclear ribonucleoprotein U-like protein 1 n=1 Tax=Chionoecetes opilio TaxID=41210 RepID=A0A8J5C495_CHIOP|nr:Heterogeneous nuclear ribonucleoprotein U-like protein 1 [Chionoecetes opilio]